MSLFWFFLRPQPDEVRAEERRIKKEKRRLEQVFFEEVRANVLASLNRGELIPGIPRNETRTEGPPIEPGLSPANSSASLAPTSPTRYDASSTNSEPAQSQSQQQQQRGSSNARIRTISGMNEKLLAELHNPPPSAASYVVAARSNSSRIPHPVAASTASTTKPAVPCAVAAPTVLLTNEGRPPLPRGRSLTMRDERASSSSVVLTQPPPLPAAASLRQPNDHYFSTQDSLELSPDPVDSHKRRATSGPNAGRGDGEGAMVDGAAAAVGDAELDGERLLDGPIFGGDVATNAASSSATANMPKKGGDGSTSTSLLSTSSHMRRNTGGTVFLQSTMENPNINATIKCVCGVYRAHIVSSSAAAAATATVPAASRDKSSAAAAFEIFRDETYRDYRRITSQNTAGHSQPVPSLLEIESFYMDFYRRSQMEQDTIIMSLIYVERLIKETNGALTPSPSNWKSILFSCMVLSSKVWDDLSMFNLDFSNVSMAVSSSRNAAGSAPAAPASSSSSLSSFSLQRTNALEVALLQTLNFNVRVAASEYAKYYFLIRTMLHRSGLLDESNHGSGGGGGNAAAADVSGAPNPNADDGQRLENRSSRYQDQLQRRAKSVDWTFRSAASLSEPVLKDSACLEQVLASQRS
jgi:Cyclin, N-terminal domain